jgi:cyclic beta-1,2-glucan synthetase
MAPLHDASLRMPEASLWMPEASLWMLALSWCQELDSRLDSAGMTAKVLQIGYQDIYRQAGAYVREMDFRFLFDPQRRVFHIGYNATAGRLDDNYYDLLASEARIASLVAISKGDVPQSHWLHLSRPLTQVNGYLYSSQSQALLS